MSQVKLLSNRLLPYSPLCLIRGSNQGTFTGVSRFLQYCQAPPIKRLVEYPVGYIGRLRQGRARIWRNLRNCLRLASVCFWGYSLLLIKTFPKSWIKYYCLIHRNSQIIIIPFHLPQSNQFQPKSASKIVRPGVLAKCPLTKSFNQVLPMTQNSRFQQVEVLCVGILSSLAPRPPQAVPGPDWWWSLTLELATKRMIKPALTPEALDQGASTRCDP